MLTGLNRLLGRQDGERRETRERHREEGLQSPRHTSRNKWFWGKHRSTGKARTSTFLTEEEQQMNKVDELTLQLQMMTNERNELHSFLANYTNNDVNNRLNSELEIRIHQKETSVLEKFPKEKEISEASSKCKELTEKTNSYHRLLRERTQMKEKVDMLRQDNRKLQQEQIFLQESCEETKRLCEETYEKIYDLLTKQQQEHQRLEEHLQFLLKQKELVIQQRDLAGKLQHHFTESQMRFEHNQHELEQNTAQEESLLQMELLQQEHYVPAPHKRTEKPGGNERHLEGMIFYIPGSRPPLKKPRPLSCEH
nr:protein Hook homolog 1-like [Myodes glareolus]